MSFIFDDDILISKLIQAGNRDLIKSAANGKIALRMAEPLLVRLQRQINPDAFPQVAPIGIEPGGGAVPQATTENLRTLGDFLQWAAANKITWNGKRIAWNTNETPPEGAWTFNVYKTDRRSRDLTTRQPQLITAYASKPELLAYLIYLRDNEGKKNKVLQVMLSKIIGQVNEFLTSAGEETIETRSKQLGRGDFDPNAVVDAFMSNEIDPANPMDGAEGYPLFVDLPKKLTMRDLSNENAFMAWLSTMRQKGSSFGLLNPKSDPCPVIHVLYQRARYLANVARAKENIKPGYTKMAEFYLKTIQEYGSRVKGPDGKSCAVTTAGTTMQMGGGTSPFDGASGAEGGKVSQQIINRIVSTLPLDIDNIDFVRIRTFFSLYNQIVSSANRGQLEAAITTANQAMDTASRLSFTGNQQNFRFTRNAQEFAAQVKQPAGNNAMTVLHALQQVIIEAGRAIGMFYSEYAKALGTGNAAFSVKSQYYGDNSVYTQNLREIQSLMDNMKTAIGVK
jgi:hypothetical protein